MKKALIIVDIQYDFLPGGSLAVKNGDKIIEKINSFQKAFDLVVATQDWHPEKHKSFAINHENRNAFEVIDLNGLPQVLWPVHCVQGTNGADLSNDLCKEKISMIIRKGMDIETDSYSGFFDNGKRNTTGLHGYLQEHKVTEVYICGLAADYCVYYTAKDAAELGYKVFYIEDATKFISEDSYNKAKNNLLELKVQFIQTDEIELSSI